MQGLQDQGEFPADLAEVTVAVDVLALMPVLQLVVFDVKPQGLHDSGPCLCVHSQQPCQSGVQLVLRRLGIEESQGGVLVKNQSQRIGWGQEGFTINRAPVT